MSLIEASPEPTERPSIQAEQTVSARPRRKHVRTRPQTRPQQITGSFIRALGGPKAISPMQKHMAVIASTLIAQIEILEAKLVKGEDIDIDVLGRLASNAMRITSKLGLEPITKRDAGPSLQDWIKETTAAKERDAS